MDFEDVSIEFYVECNDSTIDFEYKVFSSFRPAARYAYKLSQKYNDVSFYVISVNNATFQNGEIW